MLPNLYYDSGAPPYHPHNLPHYTVLFTLNQVVRSATSIRGPAVPQSHSSHSLFIPNVGTNTTHPAAPRLNSDSHHLSLTPASPTERSGAPVIRGHQAMIGIIITPQFLTTRADTSITHGEEEHAWSPNGEGEAQASMWQQATH